MSEARSRNSLVAQRFREAKIRYAKTVRILVVDDEPEVRELIRRILYGRGFEIETAENGRVAVRVAARRHFDLILMDVDMPTMNGLDACGFIKGNVARAKPPPIVMVTGSASSDDIGHAVRSNADGYLVKPFDEEALVRTVENFVASPADS